MKGVKMDHYKVTEKLTEILQILSEHYDGAVSENNTAMRSLHEQKRSAQQKMDALDKRLDPEVKEAISNLIGSYDEENSLRSIYAFLCGLKYGMRFDEWVHTSDEPLFFELIGKRDYADRYLHQNE